MRRGVRANRVCAEAFYFILEIWLAAGVRNLNYQRDKLDFSEAPQPQKGEEPFMNIFY